MFTITLHQLLLYFVITLLASFFSPNLQVMLYIFLPGFNFNSITLTILLHKCALIYFFRFLKHVTKSFEKQCWNSHYGIKYLWVRWFESKLVHRNKTQHLNRILSGFQGTYKVANCKTDELM